MVKFERFTLENGLTVLIHPDHTVPMVALNVLYDVGARDEENHRTGFAHLFEHLMFGGSINIPNYDEPLQKAGAENNAFTNNDITNYYIQIPSQNLETACWLESDRMLDLAFSPKSLETQRSVVIEEFKQRYLNQPYGDVWLKLRPLAYQVHPYQWATIGKEISHIEEASMDDVKAFYQKFYQPSNAIVVLAGDITVEKGLELMKKWFEPIPSEPKHKRNLPQEPLQVEERSLFHKGNAPQNALYKAFHMDKRNSDEYYAADLLSDILSRGESSRLYQRLVKDHPAFSEINAYITADADAGLFVVEGKPLEHVSLQEADELIWNVLEELKTTLIAGKELEKIFNKLESSQLFSEMNLLNRAMNLAYFEWLGDASMCNTEMERYRQVNATELRNTANQIFRKENCSTLYYEAEKMEGVLDA